LRSNQILIYLYIIITSGYLIWRTVFSLNMDQPIASGLFLAADIITGVSSIIFVFSFLKGEKVFSEPVLRHKLTVDVFIPTFNEDVSILRETISHCVGMDYQHKTYVLDDGNREEVRVLAEKLGAQYISRTVNEDAKAGNLNNALGKTSGNIIAVFDADFVPEKNFIVKLIGYFNDDKVAIVQSPQFYYNSNSFQHRKLFGKKTYNDQDTFLHMVLPARADWNAAYWIGTNALMRREAILSIGGFPTESVTEDILTSIYIHSKGWNSVYVDEPLAFGLAPTNISQYYTQRLRWAKGAFQIFRKKNPLFVNGLSYVQRMFYFSSLLHFFEGAIKLVYFVFPALFFIFKVVPINTSPYVIINMVIYFIMGRILISVITRDKTNIFYDEIYAVIRSFIYLMGFSALFTNKKISFAVTPKNNESNIGIINFFGPLSICTLNFVVLVSATINPSIILKESILNLVCFAWCISLLIKSSIACYYCFSTPYDSGLTINDQIRSNKSLIKRT